MENNPKKLTHWKRLVNPDYLGAYSLDPGQDLTVTIREVKREIITGMNGKKEECTVVYFNDQPKPMILNRTNSKTINKIYGTPFIEEWAGKKITLYASTTKLAGEEVECLRIRQHTPSLPELLPTDEVNFIKCKRALLNGYNIGDIRKKWYVSDTVEEMLINETI